MTNVEGADLILTNGHVRTMDDAGRVAEAIAVRGERVIAVGPSSEVVRLRGPRTRVVELRGRTVVPGFQDAHCHPVSAGLDLMRCPLNDLYLVDDYVARIANYAKAHPELDWIVGGGWSMASFPGGMPRREILDRAVPDRPAFFDSRDGHDGWVNTAGLERAGVTRETADPRDGRIGRDPDGSPMGTLHEGAQRLVVTIMPEDSAADLEAAVLRGQAELHRLGITAWQDAIVRPPNERAYRAIAGRGELTARVVGALWWDRGLGLEQVEALLERRAAGPVDRFRPTSVKLMLDGIVENRTALLTKPYFEPGGGPSDVVGLTYIEPAILHAAVTQLDALGFQCHFHAIGDGAVRLALDVCESALRANGRTDGRHHVSHIQLVHPTDIGRFAALGVVANAQPYWACDSPQMVELNYPLLGPERVAWHYPFRSLLRTGARLAMGSDWAVSTANPLLEMEVAMTRVDDETRGAPAFLPDERLTLDEALAAFTRGSAFVNHLDDTGVLSPGMLADIAVLDRDIDDPDAGPLGDARVVATFVGGSAVFEDPALGG